MNTRLYRLTPAGGKPNHYTDSYASARAKLPAGYEGFMQALEVGPPVSIHRVYTEEGNRVETLGTVERLA